MKNVVVFVVFFFGLSLSARAATIPAASCLLSDVTTAVASASTGDTITIPVGTCVWTAQLAVTKGITLQGSPGTIIKDDLTGTAATNDLSLIQWTCQLNAAQRLTGITFQDGGRLPLDTNGIVRFNCRNTGTTTLRIDHNTFDHLNGDFLGINTAVGVVDHNTFLTRPTRIPIIMRDANWDGDTAGYGDKSWSDPVAWGSSQFMFVEDNIFTYDAGLLYPCNDAFLGARSVYRFNVFNGCSLEVHGTESSGRQRGGRATEVYENTFDLRNIAPLIQDLRSGAILAWGNTAVNMQPGGNHVVVTQDEFRLINNFPFFGTGADGTSPWDVNSTGNPIASYTATSAGKLTATVTGANWPPGQWIGYTIKQPAPCAQHNCFSLILSNTADTLTWFSSAGAGFAADFALTTGSTFVLNRVQQVLDQPGSGGGQLVTGNPPVVPKGWSQPLFPSYEWANTGNGQPIHFGARNTCATCIEGVTYFNDTKLPGYTPYTYPHPLVTQ